MTLFAELGGPLVSFQVVAYEIHTSLALLAGRCDNMTRIKTSSPKFVVLPQPHQYAGEITPTLGGQCYL